MELETVEQAVAALVALYEGASDDYAQWRRRIRHDNHYRTRDRRGPSSPGPGGCALGTSLRYSAARIGDTFANGTDVLGPDFAAGDKPCFRLLLDNLGRLEAGIGGLGRRARGDGGRPAPLELRDALLASEAVRAATLRALAEQYHRVAVGRLASPRPVRRPAAPPSTAAAAAARSGAGREKRGGRAPDDDDDDEEEEEKREEKDGAPSTVDRPAVRPGQVPARRRPPPPPPPPPSPPPTPTQQLPPLPPPPLLLPPPDDAQSTCTAGTGPRPRASVFSQFCPEAVKYQVDLTRAAPRGRCRRCGYAWERERDRTGGGGSGRPAPPPSAAAAAVASPVVALRDGFRLTARFLGKSHCPAGRFACVLCTSRGATDLYATVAALRDHVDLAHDKWQMLHERDLAAR